MATELLMIRVLNNEKPNVELTANAVDISRDLQTLMLRMKGQFFYDEHSINYDGMRRSQLYEDFSELSKLLRLVDLATLDEIQKKVFVINVYNALCIHGIASLGVLPRSILDVQQFWKTTAYAIGSHVFSLDDLEHGILRANRPHPTSVDSMFQKDDPRNQFSLSALDPRIHFALNCGAKSCPAIQVYSETNVNSALDAATQTYCDQEVQLNLKHRTIVLNRLFQWYRKDFGCNETEVLRWIMKYIKPDKSFALGQMLQELEDIGGVTITYSDYDWALNCLPMPKSPQGFN